MPSDQTASRTLLLTGATGFVGRHLDAALPETDWNAARLPAMLLPRWLRYSSWPVWIEDVVIAIIEALDVPLEGSAWFDLPGPERMTHADLLSRVAKSMGKDPALVGVPVITPRLSRSACARVCGTADR